MTISSATTKVSYNGSGSVGPFSITFKFLKNADIVATKVSTAGVESTLALTTHYTLTGAGAPSGGTLTLVTALATGEKLAIKRSPAKVQETDYVENAAFPAESHEAALDLLTMITQDLQEQIDRSVKVPISSSTDPVVLIAQLSADAVTAAASASSATTQAENAAASAADAAASAMNGVPRAAAAGTVDAITATFSPAITLADKTICSLVAAGANTSATPTFAPDGLTAHTITKRGGQALAPGDIPGAGFGALLQYNLANTRWELLNPATVQEPWAVAGGTVDALTLTATPAIPALYDGLCVSFRAAAANATTTPTLNVNGLGAKTITKQGGQALAAGDIPRALYECICVYNLANTRWELLNPLSSNPNAVTAYTAQHHPTQLALTSSGGALSLDCDTCAMAYHILTENITVGALANKVNGKVVELVLVNVSGTSKTVSWNAGYLPCNGVTLPTSLANNAWAFVLVEVAGTTTAFVRNAQTYP